MPKQTIQINFTTNSWNQRFHILHVWNTGNELIVSSVSYTQGAGDSAGGRQIAETLDVDIANPLPVKHYLIDADYFGRRNPNYYSQPSKLGNIDVIAVRRETDIPENERQNCLYSHPNFTDVSIRIKVATINARIIGDQNLEALEEDHTKLVQLERRSNNPDEIRTILARNTHDRDEKIILLCLWDEYDHIIDLEKNGVLNKEEGDIALFNLHLRREDGVRIAQLKESYPSLFDKLVKPTEQASTTPISNRVEDTSPFSAQNLKNFGVFAGTFIATIALVAASRANKP